MPNSEAQESPGVEGNRWAEPPEKGLPLGVRIRGTFGDI